MSATTRFSVTKPYTDRHKHEPHCFNTNNSGLVEVHRFELPRERDEMRDTYLALPGAEELR